MAYTASTQGAQANCASVFMASLHTLFVAGGFTYVEEWTSGAETARIYKSPAASNAFGSDWYLNVTRTADTATLVLLSVAEVWDTGTKKLRNYARTASTLTPTGAFAINDATGLSPNSSTLCRKGVTINTAGFSYWASINPNRVALATRVSTTDYGVHAGLYDDMLPAAISPFPLIVNDLAGGAALGAGVGSATREPGATISTANCFGVNVSSALNFGPTWGTVDLYQGKYMAGRLLVVSSRVGGSNTTGNGWRGMLKDMVVCTISGAINGDTLAVTDHNAVVKNYVNMCAPSNGMWVDVAV